MTLSFNYYDDWQDKEYSCKCGWKGIVNRGKLDIYDALGDFTCPDCEKMLLIVQWPTPAETATAAADGNEEAQKQLEEMKKYMK